MKLYIKSPLVFLLNMLKWGLILSIAVLIRILVASPSSSFSPVFFEYIRAVCIIFPVIYSVAFLEAMFFLVKKSNKSWVPLMTLFVLLTVISLLVQPLLYSLTRNIANVGTSDTLNLSLNKFLVPTYSLAEFLKEVFFILDDSRQVYFTGYVYYLFFSASFLIFLASLMPLTLKARWNFFNFFSILILLRFLIYMYAVMNMHDKEIYIFSFSTNTLRGIPTYIIIIGTSLLILLYGIISRLKKAF